MKNKDRVLFILKKRTIYSEYSYSEVNSGLYNSATFVEEMLYQNGVDSHLVEVTDNNEIDKVVSLYQPTHVIIEALWVTPEKFKVLQKLHPKVTWIIRLHSELPFLANEGVAIGWLKEYSNYKNVVIAANSQYLIDAMQPVLDTKIWYMPNYYPDFCLSPRGDKSRNEIKIGLFGAIRPLKNLLSQAVGAMLYANANHKKLFLHINTERVEQRGENVLKNLRALFEGTKHELVEHKWLKHCDFVKLVATMDLGLQVSLTETYNIVSADFVQQQIPVVTSKEITFVSSINQVDVTKDAVEIAGKIKTALKYPSLLTWVNKLKLRANSKQAEKVWLKLFK